MRRVSLLGRAAALAAGMAFVYGCTPAATLAPATASPSAPPSIVVTLEPSTVPSLALPSDSAAPSDSAEPSPSGSPVGVNGNPPHAGGTPPNDQKVPAGHATGLALPPSARSPQDSTYHYYGYDRMYAVKGPVTADGYILWYQTHPGLLEGLPTLYGQFKPEWIYATKAVDCIYFQVSWNKLTGSASLPPGGSVNSETVSDGMYQSCRKKGYDRPFYWSIQGYDYASHALTAVTIKVCYANAPLYVKFCSSAKHYN